MNWLSLMYEYLPKKTCRIVNIIVPEESVKILNDGELSCSTTSSANMGHHGNVVRSKAQSGG